MSHRRTALIAFIDVLGGGLLGLALFALWAATR